MMRRETLVYALVLSVSLAACGSGSSTTPGGPAAATLAGEFTGSVVDSVAGTESGDLVLSQHGASAGGTMSLTVGAASTVESVALTVTGTSFGGSGVMDVNGSACTYAISGTYTNDALTATYTGVSGCMRTGSWSLQQSCVGTPESAERRTQGTLPRC